MKSILISCLFIVALSSSALYAQDSKLSKASFTKAMVHFNNARYPQAITEFTKAITLDSSNYNAWIRRGFTRGITGDFEGEFSDYTQVITHDPEHKFAYISRGSALNKVGKYEAAIADFNKALEIDAGDAEAYNNRGFAYKGLGNADAACRDWNKSKDLGNKEAKVILENNHCH